ncbi:MAG: energy-coupling factor transporter ATPase [Eubacteriales bacterium]
MNPIIKTENLCFSYKSESGEKAVLKDISLEIQRGSFTVVLGHNGSGKSTLAKHFNMILTPTSGKVYINGMDTSVEDNLYEVRRCVGMVFQNPDNQLVATVVEEDVAFGPENLGVPPQELRDRVDFALAEVGMSEYKLHAPHQLSGGQKQRVAIAGIIAMLPDCIILDESTSMLDPKGRLEVMDTIKRLNSERGITVILITHYMNEAVQADRVVIISGGEITLDGTPSQVFSQVEKIEKAGLEVPQVTQLMHGLEKHGIHLPQDIIHAADAADAIEGWFRK